MLPGSELLLAEHASEMPQKNELCGAFWITLALRALASVKVEQDHVGLAAGSILSKIQTTESLPSVHCTCHVVTFDLNIHAQVPRDRPSSHHTIGQSHYPTAQGNILVSNYPTHPERRQSARQNARENN